MYTRQTDYGREVRIRLWYGIGIEDQKIHYTIPDTAEAPKIAMATLNHIIQEYTNDQYLEMAFWRMFH